MYIYVNVYIYIVSFQSCSKIFDFGILSHPDLQATAAHASGIRTMNSLDALKQRAKDLRRLVNTRLALQKTECRKHVVTEFIDRI